MPSVSPTSRQARKTGSDTLAAPALTRLPRRCAVKTSGMTAQQSSQGAVRPTEAPPTGASDHNVPGRPVSEEPSLADDASILVDDFLGPEEQSELGSYHFWSDAPFIVRERLRESFAQAGGGPDGTSLLVMSGLLRSLRDAGWRKAAVEGTDGFGPFQAGALETLEAALAHKLEDTLERAHEGLLGDPSELELQEPSEPERHGTWVCQARQRAILALLPPFL
mgnify:CR=1 FL=1